MTLTFHAGRIAFQNLNVVQIVIFVLSEQYLNCRQQITKRGDVGPRRAW